MGKMRIFSHHINFGNRYAHPDLKLDRSDISIKAIVGPKGSGKTFYLRQIEDYCINEDAYFSIEMCNSIIDQLSVRRLSTCVPGDKLTNTWQVLWHNAILLSLASQFFSRNRPEYFQNYLKGNKSKSDYLATKSAEFRNDYVPEFVNTNFSDPFSIVAAANMLISSVSDDEDVNDQLSGGQYNWHSLNAFLRPVLDRFPLFVFFIDNLDDDFRHAPAEYIDCYKGLYYSIKNFRKNNTQRNKVKILITMREIIYSSVIYSENGSKVIWDNGLKTLFWNNQAAKHFLGVKLQRARDHEDANNFFIDLEQGSDLKAFLGFDEIHNEVYDCDESVEDYIIRHTHNTPRELVAMLNSVSQQVATAKDFNAEYTQELFKRAVNESSRFFTEERLKIAANFIASSSYTRRTRLDQYDKDGDFDFDEIASDHHFKVVKNVIRTVGKIMFDLSELAAVVAPHNEEFEAACDRTQYKLYKIENSLWQTGILGYREVDATGLRRDVFHSNDMKMSPFYLPTDKDAYIFHPGIVGLLKIDVNGDAPVGAS